MDKSVKQFICDQCPFATHAQLYLNVHKRKDHVNKRQKEFLCDNCPKEFDLKGKVSILEVESLLPFSALEIKPCGLKFKNSRCLFLEL